MHGKKNTMKIKFSIGRSIAWLLCIATATLAQGSLTLMVGPAFPAGAFANDDPWNPEASRVGAGAGVGACYQYQIAHSALGLYGSADLVFHSAGSTARETWESFNPDAQFTLSRAILVPLSAGIAYILKPDPQYSLYGRTGAVVSFSRFTEFDVKQPGYEKYSETYDPASAFGYQLGAGLSGKKISLEARYLHLGEHKISGSWKEGSDSGTLPQVKKRIELFFITLGWKLR